MLLKCINCNFYVSRLEENCPNCGISKPTVWLEEAMPFNIKYIAGISVALWAIILTIYFLSAKDKQNLVGVLTLSFVVSCTVGVILGFVVDFYFFEREKKRRTKETKTSLTSKENLIQRRIEELKSRAEMIQKVLSRFDDSISPPLKNAEQKLLTAQQIVQNQSARYYLQAKRINLVRTQNHLAPLVYDSEILSFNDTEKGFEQIKAVEIALQNLQDELIKFRFNNISSDVLPEINDVLSELDDTKASCQKLREGLLTRQAIYALEGIAPLQEIASGDSSKTNLPKDSAKFNIQVALTDFTNRFDELEAEYERLKSESDLSRQLAAKLESL